MKIFKVGVLFLLLFLFPYLVELLTVFDNHIIQSFRLRHDFRYDYPTPNVTVTITVELLSFYMS